MIFLNKTKIAETKRKNLFSRINTIFMQEAKTLYQIFYIALLSILLLAALGQP